MKRITAIILFILMATSAFAADQRILYTEKMVGANHPTLTDTLNRLSLVEHNNDGTHKYVGASNIIVLKTGDGLNAAITSAGSTTTTFLIVGTVTSNATVTIPANISLEFSMPGNITRTSGTLYVNSPITAGNYQIFVGYTGATIQFPNGVELNPRWFGATGDGVTNDTTALQSTINSASYYSNNVHITYGNYSFTKLYLVYNAVTNPEYSSDVLRQGRMRIYGDGELELGGLNNDSRARTVLVSTDATGPAISADWGSSPWPIRLLRIENMTVIANNTSQVMFLNGVVNRSMLSRLVLEQQNDAGGGLVHQNTWMTNGNEVYIYNTGAGTKTGTGFLMRNVDISGGMVSLEQFHVQGFYKGTVFGHETYGEAAVLNNVSVRAIQNHTNTIGMEITSGVKAMSLITPHFEANTDYGLKIYNNAGSTTVKSGYFNDGSTAIADVLIGDSTLAGVARETGAIEFDGCHFLLIPNIGIKRDFNGDYSYGLIVKNSVFSQRTVGQGVGISLLNQVQQRGVVLLGNYFNPNLATDVENGDRADLNVNGEVVHFGRFVNNRQSQNTASARTLTLTGDGNSGLVYGTNLIYSLTPVYGTLPGATYIISSVTASVIDTVSAPVTATSVVSSGTTATFTKATHGFTDGDGVVIAGANETEYNGYFPISVVDADTFTYVLSTATVTSPATGTVTANLGNLKLDGDFIGQGERTLSLYWDGTYWIETGRTDTKDVYGSLAIGNASYTAQVGVSPPSLRFNTALTATRSVTLSTDGASKGDRFHIVRGPSATGGYNLNIGTGPLKSLTAADQWCIVEFNGTSWGLIAYGAL